MDDKGINIPVTTTGTDAAKEDMRELKRALEEFNLEFDAPMTKGAENLDKVGTKLSGIDTTLTGLATKVTAFATGFLGLETAIRLIDHVADKLEKIATYQKEIYDHSQSLAQLGQNLEMVTGTKGQQQEWAKKIAELQAAGGFPDSATAEQAMVAANAAFTNIGGIQNPAVAQMLTQISPGMNAMGMGVPETDSFFRLANAAGIGADAGKMNQFLSQLREGFGRSKMTNFGEYLGGLKGAGVNYLATGGSTQEAISVYSSAAAVSGEPGEAAEILTQATRLSEGAYEKPKKAIEDAFGIKYDNLNSDQKMEAILQYASSIPAEQRVSTLAALGLRPGIAMNLARLAGAEGQSTQSQTTAAVQGATGANINEMGQTYLQSQLAKSRINQGQHAVKHVGIGAKVANWQERLNKAAEDMKETDDAGDFHATASRFEQVTRSFESMRDETNSLIESLPEDTPPELRKRAIALRDKLTGEITQAQQRWDVPGLGRWSEGDFKKTGTQSEQELSSLRQSINIHNHYDNSVTQNIGGGGDLGGNGYNQDE